MLFNDDGSVDFKEFIKQFNGYQHNSDFITNYYSYRIINEGIKKYANDRFWEAIRFY